MNNPEYILNEVNKGIKMGMDSISNISGKVTNSNLKKDLQFQSKMKGDKSECKLPTNKTSTHL